MANLPMLQPFNLAALGKTRDLSKVNTNEGLTLDQFQELLLGPETAFFYKKSLVFKDNRQKKSYANDLDFQVWANGFAPTQREVATLQKLVQQQGMLFVLVASEHKRGGMPLCLTERVMRVPYNGDLVQGSKSERFLKGALKGGMGETGKTQKDMAVGASFSDSDGDDLRWGDNSKEESVVEGGQCDDFVILISEQDVETSQEKGKSLKQEVEYREDSLEKDEEYWQERAAEQDQEWRPERAKSAKHQVKDADTSSEAYSPEDDCGEGLSSDASDSSEGETDDNDSSSASSSDDYRSLDSDIDSEAGVDAKRLRRL
ncbi:hypothetical protein BDR26DRAFT_938147 [Obelidium mucronatum]|nr:hypothetical protein BDR26DRAFT_938147 [Obelidium mucronatum]